jgi:fatty-acyl-CoA synthase
MRATLWQEYRHSFAIHADRTAVRMGDIELTYAELEAWSAAAAAQLSAAGLQAGDAIALYLRNSIEYLVADVAIARLGAVKVPVNFMLPVETVGYILAHSGARALIVSADLSTDGVTVPAVVFECQDPAGSPPRAGARRLAGRPDQIPAATATAEASPDGDPSAPAAIYYTGGTTGSPKGVLHTQGSTVALHYAQMLEAEITDTDRLLLMTPLAHAAGLFAQTALLRGATVVLTDKFDAAGTLDLLSRERVSWTFLVPTMIYRLLEAIRERGEYRSSLKTIVYGAAPIAPSRLSEALDRFGPIFVQLYGQTESPNWGTRLTKSDHDPARPHLLSSCGRASIMADVKIVDDDGLELPAGAIGEICLRTPYLLREYLGDPAATRAKFLGGWIRTGDIGLVDTHGYVYLKDRKNDMVITGGMNVYCREVEDVLGRHPDIRAVAVIGIPHEDWGESVHACVVRADDKLTGEELLAWSRDKLAAYASPKSVEFVDELPETPFGKIDKKQLRGRYWRGHDRAIS